MQRDSDRYLDTQVTIIRGWRVDALFRGRPDGTGILYVRSAPTRYAVWHELSHILDFRKNPARWINPATTEQLGRRLREQGGFNRLRNSRCWWQLTTAEKYHAMKYVEMCGGNSEINLETGRTLSSYRFE